MHNMIRIEYIILYMYHILYRSTVGRAACVYNTVSWAPPSLGNLGKHVITYYIIT